MARKQTPERSSAGLYSQHNPFSRAPEGSLQTARNASCDREGVVANRRGFKRYGPELSGIPKTAWEFDGRIVVLDGTTLKHDSDGAGTAWTSWSGDYTAPDPDIHMQSLELAKNVYFTTGKGIYRNDSLTGTPRPAGLPEGLDMELTATGTGGGYLIADRQYGYRVIFVTQDTHLRTIRGAPSTREVFFNSLSAVAYSHSGGVVLVTQTAHGYLTGDTVELSGMDNASLDGSQTITVIDADSYTYGTDTTAQGLGSGSAGKNVNVNVKFTLPDDVQAGDEYELYRTAQSASAATDPLDEGLLLRRDEITPADITAGTVTYLDSVDDAFLGVRLYTNQTREGLNQENSRPPLAKFIVEFKGHVFYFNYNREHQLSLKQISSDTDFTSTTIQITDGAATLTITFDDTESVAADTARQYTSTNSTDLHAKRIELTAKSIVRVINQSSNSLWRAKYTSGTEDPPGQISISSRTMNGRQFWMTNASASSVADSFEPAVPTSGAALISDNGAKVHAAARSKFGEPDHVPTLNYNSFGRDNQAVLAAIALTEAILVLKEDGLFRLTGESDGGGGFRFVTNRLDPTVILDAPGSLVALDNAAWGFTVEGSQRMTGNGAAIVSRSIEPDLNRLAESNKFTQLTQGVGYNYDKKLILITQGDRGDTRARAQWCYNYLNNTWTRWDKDASFGLVLSKDKKLYLLHNVDKYVLQERKDFALSDYQDETLDTTITANEVITNAAGAQVTRVIVTHDYYKPITDGWLLEQGALEAKVAIATKSGTSFTLTLDRKAGFEDAAATITMPIYLDLTWVPEAAGNPAMMKQFTEWCIYFERAHGTVNKCGFQSDMMATREFSGDIELTQALGWGSAAWGSAPWGDGQGKGQVVRCPIPRDHQRCRAISPTFRHNVCKERVEVLWTSFLYREAGIRVQADPR